MLPVYEQSPPVRRNALNNATPPLRCKALDQEWTPAYGVNTPAKTLPPQLKAFDTPLLNKVLSPHATGNKASPLATPVQSGTIAITKGISPLAITVIDHPKYEGVLVSRLDVNGACYTAGMKVGDHIMQVCGIRARDHRTCMWLADAAENRVRFGLADSSEVFTINRSLGDVGLTLVNNTQAGIGCVVVRVASGLGGDRAGLQVGHVILSVQGELGVRPALPASWLSKPSYAA